MDLIEKLMKVHSALDGALGDTDVSHIENDDELREEQPVQWAAQRLMEVIAELEKVETVICPDCRGERRVGGSLCKRCGGNAMISKSQLAPGEKGAFS
jgi:hypothetical protein